MANWEIWLVSILIMILPMVFVIAGLILWMKTPLPNTLFGYRTKKSLSDSETWFKTNQLYGKFAFIFGIIGIVILIPTLIFTLLDKPNITLTIFLAYTVLSLVIPIVVVEIKIK